MFKRKIQHAPTVVASSNKNAVLKGHKVEENYVHEINTFCYRAVSTLPLLIDYLQLNKDLPFYDAAVANLNRSKLLYCIHTVMGVLQKCSPRELVSESYNTL